MIVSDLNKMEKIVAKNSNLSWIGWDVVDYKKSDIARTAINGVRVNGEWFLKKTYTVTREGWNIPNKYWS